MLQPKVLLVKPEVLKEHEGIERRRLRRLLAQIVSDGVLRKAIAVDLNTYVILDGHHRLHVLKQLGCASIPICLFDYTSPEIEVHGQKRGSKFTKQDVMEAALSGNTLPPHSTKHMVKLKGGKLVHLSVLENDVNIPITKLQRVSRSGVMSEGP